MRRYANQKSPTGGVPALPASSTQPALGLVGALGEALDHVGELLEALVRLPVLPRREAGEDALQDDRELPAGEGHVEVDLGEVASRPLGVAAANLLARGEPRGGGGGVEERHELVARLRPVDDQHA